MTSQVQERPQEVIPQQLLDLQDFGQTGQNLEDGAARNVLELRNVISRFCLQTTSPGLHHPGPVCLWADLGPPLWLLWEEKRRRSSSQI